VKNERKKPNKMDKG